MNFRARLYTTDNRKIYNAAILTKESLDPWMKILKHDDKKTYKPLSSTINIAKCTKLKTRAKDELGLNANMIINRRKRKS